MTELFPLGWKHYLAGGALIGVGTALIFLLAGIRAGASGFFTTIFSYVSQCGAFRTRRVFEERDWRTLFSLGLVLGALAFSLLFVRTPFVTTVSAWRLLIGGLLVGFGTRLSRGCTSGHGICGLSAGSKSSFAAVVTFMLVGIAVAHAVEALGVRP